MPSSVTCGWSAPVTVIVARARLGSIAAISVFASASALANGALVVIASVRMRL
jgi:hypothetical protein